MRIFHHIGLPTDEEQPGEVYVEDTKVWVTDPADHPRRVEFLRFADDSPVTGPVRELPHMAFRVDDVETALDGEEIILAPFSPRDGLIVAFFARDGAVFEYMQFAGEATEFRDLDEISGEG